MFRKGLVLLVICLFVNGLFAQTTDTEEVKADSLIVRKVEMYKGNAERMVRFFEYALNTVGDGRMPKVEKETVINESYLKFFRDAEVQIEDDLDENRKMPINKNVQAYLKDVDFFFKEAEFEFEIDTIEHFVNDSNVLFFRVSMVRSLKVIDIKGDTIQSVRERFVEINVDELTNDLKIVSIYTTKLNADAELTAWWNVLAVQWKSFFTQTYNLPDSVTPERLRQLHEITELDLSEQDSITDWSPLSKFVNLQKLNLSGSGITSLASVRNYTKLQVLDISNTNVADLAVLKYLTELTELYAAGSKLTDASHVAQFAKLLKIDVSDTDVADLGFATNLLALTDLRLSNTKVSSIKALANCNALEVLKLNNTAITDISSLKGKKALAHLYAENSGVSDLSALASASSIKILYLNGSKVEKLDPLAKLQKLEKVYCNNTLVTKVIADAFMEKHKNALVVYKSDLLLSWWKGLPAEWKKVFKAEFKVSDNPTAEELHVLTANTKLSINGNKAIKDINPLKQFLDLTYLDLTGSSVEGLQPLTDLIDLKEVYAAHTNIRRLQPLAKMHNLQRLDISSTKVHDLQPLVQAEELEWLGADSTGLINLKGLSNLKKLKLVYAEATKLEEKDVDVLFATNPTCLVVWQTDSLQTYWDSTEVAWQKVFAKHTVLDAKPTREQLHRWAMLTKIEVIGNRDITRLDPLTSLHQLTTLTFSGTAVSNIDPIAKMKRLQFLSMPNNPITDISPVGELPNLLSVNIANTQVKNLKALMTLRKLEYLNCSGTKVRSLKPLTGLQHLKSLDCYNSSVSSLKPLFENRKLAALKCYNTRLSESKVAAFKEANKKCKVVHY